MRTRNVVLTDRQEKLIEDLVNAGRYQNASEVLRDGLRLVEEREARNAARLEALRTAAQKGFEAVDRGDHRDFDSFDDMERYLTEVTEAAARSSGV